jgi:hypothetical protein
MCDVTAPADIEAALRKRHGAGINSFWLGYEAGGFPALNILVKGNLAHVHYFPNEDHPGFASVAKLPVPRPDELRVFFINPTEEIDILNGEVIPFSDALKAAQEFAVSATMPKCIRWNSLVEGE